MIGRLIIMRVSVLDLSQDLIFNLSTMILSYDEENEH